MIKWLGLSALVLALDQLTKYVVVTQMLYQDHIEVLPFFSWVRWHNPGAAFSFLSGAGGWQRWFFTCLAIGFSAFIIYELSRLPKQEKVMGWVFGLILGGALGNLTDRLHHGYVVDFILFHYEQNYFPAFNVADSALFCGAVTWVIYMFVEYRQGQAAGRERSDV